MTLPTPYYFGGMILSDMATAYDYENWLVAMLQYRYDKYKSNWSFFMGMETLMQGRKYISNDFHQIPEDPLVHIPEDLIYTKAGHTGGERDHTVRGTVKQPGGF